VSGGGIVVDHSTVFQKIKSSNPTAVGHQEKYCEDIHIFFSSEHHKFLKRREPFWLSGKVKENK
jgi:hypothetical protein